MRHGRPILVGLAKYGHHANGYTRSYTARVADEPFVDALVFPFGRSIGCNTMYIRTQLYRCLARRVLLFADDRRGLFVVSFVFRQAEFGAFLACHCSCRSIVCRVRAALAMLVPWGGGSAVVAPFVAALYADFAAGMLIWCVKYAKKQLTNAKKCSIIDMTKKS